MSMSMSVIHLPLTSSSPRSHSFTGCQTPSECLHRSRFVQQTITRLFLSTESSTTTTKIEDRQHTCTHWRCQGPNKHQTQKTPRRQNPIVPLGEGQVWLPPDHAMTPRWADCNFCGTQLAKFKYCFPHHLKKKKNRSCTLLQMPGILEVEAGGWGVKRLSLATRSVKFVTLFQKVQVLDNALRWSQTWLLAQAFNLSSWEEGAGGSEFQDSQGLYRVTLFQKQNTKQDKNKQKFISETNKQKTTTESHNKILHGHQNKLVSKTGSVTYCSFCSI